MTTAYERPRAVSPDDIRPGDILDKPSGLRVRVLSISARANGYREARLENLNGKRPGLKSWENLTWLAENVGKPNVQRCPTCDGLGYLESK
jgi:hypothetical protein